MQDAPFYHLLSAGHDIYIFYAHHHERIHTAVSALSILVCMLRIAANFNVCNTRLFYLL
jgi:hypothetical protein